MTCVHYLLIDWNMLIQLSCLSYFCFLSDEEMYSNIVPKKQKGTFPGEVQNQRREKELELSGNREGIGAGKKNGRGSLQNVLIILEVLKLEGIK